MNIFEEDWDNLLILDACRYDMFEQNHNLPGRLESRQSRGSNTVEFLRANFADRDLQDTVYVTANPQLYRKRDRIDVDIHDIQHIWSEEGWDEVHGTVLPETVTKHAKSAMNGFPNKRLIVHYIQPHYPFIKSNTKFDKDHLDDPEESGSNIWDQLMRGQLDQNTEQIREAYEQNLEIVLLDVEELMTSLSGKTVVTSDHGNMVGERAFPVPIREWGHPRGIYTTELVKVPWLVYDEGSRKDIVAEDATSEEHRSDDEIVADRLKQLGYAE